MDVLIAQKEILTLTVWGGLVDFGEAGQNWVNNLGEPAFIHDICRDVHHIFDVFIVCLNNAVIIVCIVWNCIVLIWNRIRIPISILPHVHSRNLIVFL